MNYLDPAEYGVDRKKRNLYQFPIDARTPPFLEEPPTLDTPSAMTAPPALDTPQLPGSREWADQMDRGSDAALERYKELAAKPPKLEYKKGALGVLQRIGDAVVRPDVMHPNFTRETENYNRDLDAQGKVVKAAGSMADDARKRAKYESDLSVNEQQTAEARKRGSLADKQTESLRLKELHDSLEYRIEQAAKLGLEKGTPAYQHYVIEGKAYDPKNAPQPSGPSILKEATDTKVFLQDKKKLGPLTPEEDLKLRQALETLRKNEADIEKSRSQTVLNVNTVPGRTASGDVTKETLENMRTSQQVKQDTDYVLAEAARLGTDPKELAKNIMNPAYFTDWGDDQARRSAVVAEIQARENKKKTQRRNSFQSAVPLPSAAPAAPPATKPVAMAPPASIEKQVAEGGTAKGPDGSVWVKKNGVMIQQGSENA